MSLLCYCACLFYKLVQLYIKTLILMSCRFVVTQVIIRINTIRMAMMFSLVSFIYFKDEPLIKRTLDLFFLNKITKLLNVSSSHLWGVATPLNNNVSHDGTESCTILTQLCVLCTSGQRDLNYAVKCIPISTCEVLRFCVVSQSKAYVLGSVCSFGVTKHLSLLKPSLKKNMHVFTFSKTTLTCCLLFYG